MKGTSKQPRPKKAVTLPVNAPVLEAPLEVRVESPSWRDLQRLGEETLHLLGGPKGAADKLTGESFYTVVLLASLRLDATKAAAPIFGRQWPTSEKAKGGGA